MIKIGIDPGPLSGAIAIKAEGMTNHWTIREFAKIPYFELDMLLKTVKQAAERNGETIYCVIEKQIPMPKQSLSATANHQQHYGYLLGLLLANGIPHKEVVPRSWMKLYNMKKKKGETQTEWKNRLKQKAKELEPDIKVLSNNADAILIALKSENLFK